MFLEVLLNGMYIFLGFFLATLGAFILWCFMIFLFKTSMIYEHKMEKLLESKKNEKIFKK